MRILLTIGSFPDDVVGGAERQLLLLTQGLQERGHDVLYLATDAGVDSFATERDIQVRRLPGFHVVGRRKHLTDLSAVIEEFAPDVCCVRWLGDLPNISAVCSAGGIPVISAAGSLKDSSPILTGENRGANLRNLFSGRVFQHWWSFVAIRRSSAHVCNTRQIADRTRKWSPGTEIYTIYNGSPVLPYLKEHGHPARRVIWVNNIKPIKRPDVYVELARKLPQWEFLMVGGMPPAGRYARAVQGLLQNAPRNLCYLGARSLEEVEELIAASDLLLYTSKSEGFGNSFLQAWMRGIPTGSLEYDLDGILERENVGFVARDFDELVGKTRLYLQDECLRTEAGRRAHSYASRFHSVAKMVTAYEELFATVLPCKEPVTKRHYHDIKMEE